MFAKMAIFEQFANVKSMTNFFVLKYRQQSGDTNFWSFSFNTLNETISVCRYVLKKFTQKYALEKTLWAKNSLKLSQFYRFFGNFSKSHNFFFRIHTDLNFRYVLELVKFYWYVYFLGISGSYRVPGKYITWESVYFLFLLG